MNLRLPSTAQIFLQHPVRMKVRKCHRFGSACAGFVFVSLSPSVTCCRRRSPASADGLRPEVLATHVDGGVGLHPDDNATSRASLLITTAKSIHNTSHPLPHQLARDGLNARTRLRTAPLATIVSWSAPANFAPTGSRHGHASIFSSRNFSLQY